MADHTISVAGLHRSYGAGADTFEAVRGIDLRIAPGTIHALLGVNGAGKTSAMEVIEGLAAPTAGEVRVLGLDPIPDRAAVRRHTGVLLQRSGFVSDLSVAETLQMWAGTVTEARPLAESLEMLDLAGRRDVRMRNLSGGEQRRVDLACALMGRPDVLMLDEPTTGLDPESRRSVWELLRGLRDAGATVLLTTHYLEEAEALADDLSIMSAGRIVRAGPPELIVADHPSRITFRTPDRDLPALPGARVTGTAGTTTLEVRDLQAGLTRLLGWADRHDVRLDRLSARTASLESVFLEIAEGDAEHVAPRPAPGPGPATTDSHPRPVEGAVR